MGQRDIKRLATRFNDRNPVRILIITMSDRAHAGKYEDEGGPAILGTLEAHFHDTGIPLTTECVILPDDRDELREKLIAARDGNVHAVFTTGGTGVSPRDITPDVVLELADKTIPGIMEVIRVRHGLEMPLAALSRTVAAVIGDTMVYTLPGSPKAVQEYMAEIVKTLDHVLCLIQGIAEH